MNVMTATESLRRTVRVEQHHLSHELAERLFADVERLLREGYEPAEVRQELDAMFEEFRLSGQAVQRDALVEVLDELDTLTT